jgi:hypothetical protein
MAERPEGEGLFDRTEEIIQQYDEIIIGIGTPISAGARPVEKDAFQAIAVSVGKCPFDDRNHWVGGQMVGKTHRGNIVHEGGIVTRRGHLLDSATVL